MTQFNIGNKKACLIKNSSKAQCRQRMRSITCYNATLLSRVDDDQLPNFVLA